MDITLSNFPVVENNLPTISAKRSLSDTSSTTAENQTPLPTQLKKPKKNKKKKKIIDTNAITHSKSSEKEDSNCSSEKEYHDLDPNSKSPESGTNNNQEESQSENPKTLEEIFAPLKHNFETKDYPIKSVENFAILVDICHKDANTV